jgi:hypothetical protein
MFRGAGLANGKRYWAGSFWSNGLGRTSFFQGLPVVPPVPPTPPANSAAGGAGGGFAPYRKHLWKDKRLDALKRRRKIRRRTDDMLVVLLADDDL